MQRQWLVRAIYMQEICAAMQSKKADLVLRVAEIILVVIFVASSAKSQPFPHDFFYGYGILVWHGTYFLCFPHLFSPPSFPFPSFCQTHCLQQLHFQYYKIPNYVNSFFLKATIIERKRNPCRSITLPFIKSHLAQ